MKKQVTLLLLALALGVGLWFASARLGAPDPAVVGSEASAPSARPGTEAEGAEPQPPPLELELADAPSERAVPEVDSDSVADTVQQAATGTLLLRAALEDGTPAPGVKAFVSLRHATRLGHETSEHTTDADGLALVGELRPGTYTVFCPEGPQEWAEVTAGAETEVLLTLRGVVAVRGVVRDPTGAPVANAEVWLVSWRTDWLGVQLLTHSEADGRFLAAHVGRQRSLGATADGFAPSALVDLEQVDSADSPVAIELELAPGGGSLRGLVLDPNGAPVSGARVAIGHSTTDYSMRRDGTTEEFWGARTTRTDASGAFVHTGLEAGPLPLRVVADAYPEHASEVEIPAGGTATVEVLLSASMSVRGVVMDESGEPVAGALVLALDAPFVDPFPTQGPTERGAPFHRPGTRSDDAGAFHLTCLPPGEVHVYSSKGTSFWDRGEFLGAVQETLEGAAGEVLEWKPVLSPGHEIRGRVQYADGAPLLNVFVSATDDDGRQYTEHTDDGRFAIPGLEHRAYEVWVQLWDAPDDAGPLKREDVWPSAGELLLTAEYSKATAEKGVVRARIDDRAGRIAGKGSIQFAHSRGAYYSEEREGVFSAELPPDRYQARVLSGDTVVGAGAWFELAPGEERDLGEIPTRGTGSLIVRVLRPRDEPERAVSVEVRPDDLDPASRRPLGAGETELIFEELLAGPTTVTVTGSRVAREARNVTVQAAAPTVVAIELVPAAQIDVELTSTRTEGFGVVTLRLLGTQGKVFGELTYQERYGAEFPLRAAFFAPAGRYTFEATSSTGLAARTELVIESLTADAQASLAFE